MRADLVQEVTVVADDHHGRVVVVQRPFQPADRVDVEVVGRLVEQQHVGAREQGLRQQHAQLKTGRHLAHRAVVLGLGDPGIGQDSAGTRLGVVPAVLRELALQLRGAHVVVVGCLRIGVDEIALLHRRPHLGVTLHHDVENALVFVAELVLVQLAEPHPSLQHHLARRRLEVAAEYFHQGRLAGTVGADQPVTVAVRELDGDLLEQRLTAELDCDVGGREHRVSNSQGRRVGTSPALT